MAVIDSPLSSYSDTTSHKRIITDYISLIDPSEAPVVEMLGGLDGAAGKFRFVPGKSTKVEWLEDTLPPLTDTTTASIASAGTTLTVADSSIYQEGMVLLLGGAEYIWVSDAAASATTLTVTRNYGGTQASQASAASIEIVSMARLEGDDSDDLAFTDKTAPYNYTQIFHQEVKASGTIRELEQYGLSDEMVYQMNKAVPHLMRLVNKTAYHGQRAAGSATTPRGMGGFPTFITDNTVDYGSAITQANIEDAAEAAYNDGGTGPWLMFVTPAHMQVIKNIYDNSSYLRVDRMETTIGMTIGEIITPFGSVIPVVDRHARSAWVPLVDQKLAGFSTYRPFQWEPLAKTGDSDKVQVVGEFTLCVAQDKAHAVLTT